MSQNFGLKVSRPGQDVKTTPSTAGVIRDTFSLLSSGNFSLLKAKVQGKVTLTSGTDTTIAHGLAYTPIAFAFINQSGKMTFLYNNVGSTSMYVDGTNLYLKNNSGATCDIYYYVFYDSQ